MKKRSGLIKNIIMVVASALTLVAVSFAWFTSNFETNLENYEFAVSGETINVDFYQADDSGEYQPLEGDIELNNFVPGEYNKYKFEITTKTADKLKLRFSIDGMPEDIPQELRESVCIKYTVYPLLKRVSADGNVFYVNDSAAIAQSDGYVSLSELNNGEIIKSLLISNEKSKVGDKFAIYYEIGLSEEAPSEVSGMESGLGRVNVSAQRAG